MEPVEGLPKRGSLDAGPGFPLRSNGTPPPAVFGTGSIKLPTHGFSDHLGLVDKLKKSMENVVVKCPVVTSGDQSKAADKQLRLNREQLNTPSNQLEGIKTPLSGAPA